MTSNQSCGTSRPIKVVVVGDGTVGKTCLLISYTTGEFPTGEYIPTVFENYAGSLDCEGTQVNLTLWDTAGQEDYERLRPLSYPGADVFLLCFSVDNIHSYHNIVAKWQPEVKHHCPKAPYILVGTKTDLRYTNGRAKNESQTQLNSTELDTIGPKQYLTKSMGKKLSNKIKSAKYVECSAKTMTGVTQVFNEAVRIALSPPTHRMCRIL